MIKKITNSKIGRIGLAALVLVLSGCATTKNICTSYETKPKDGTVVELDKLQFYDGPGIATYGAYGEISQEEGEKQLAELSLKCEREDAWIFNNENKRWTDVGETYKITKEVDKKTGSESWNGASIAVSSDALDSCFIVGDTLTFYHNHPNPSLKKDKSIVEFEEPTSSPALEDFFNALPSAADYAYHNCLKSDFTERKINLTPSRVVSPIFTAEYQFNKDWPKEKIQKELNRAYDDIKKRFVLPAAVDSQFDLPIEFKKKIIQAYLDELNKAGLSTRIVNYNFDEYTVRSTQRK